MTQLSGLDAAFLHLEATVAPMHLGMIAIYDPVTAPGGRFSYERYRENVEKRLHLSRCFRRKVAHVPFDADHPYWVEDAAFDLDAHIHHVALPRPGNWQQLCVAASRFQERRLDPDKPLWEMEVIEGLDDMHGLSAGAFAVAAKVHHSAIDGIAGAELIAALHDQAADAEPEPPQSPWAPEREPGAIARLARIGANIARRSVKLPRLLANSAPAAAGALRELGGGDRPLHLAPRTRFNGRVSPRRVFEARSFDLQGVHEIKKSLTGATVNDVVLAVCGGALRKYLEAEGELPEDTLRAIVPISVRGKAEQGTGGNHFSYMTVSVRSDLADPVARFGAVQQDTFQAKARGNAIDGGLLADSVDFIPGSVFRHTLLFLRHLAGMHRVNRLCNTIITNVPGPPTPLYSAGAQLRGIYGFAPIMDGLGLIHVVFSYCGQITIAVSCCSDMMPNPAFYAACLDESFEELECTVCGPSTLRPIRARAHVSIDELRVLMADELGLEPEELVSEARLDEDLGLDKVDVLQLTMVLEDALDLERLDYDPRCMRTLGDVERFLCRLV